MSPAAYRAYRQFYSARKPTMPANARFALIPTLSGAIKPTVFGDLDGLCRRIHRMRGKAGIELQDHTLHMEGDGAEGRRTVAVYTQDVAGGRDRFLGWAWLDGASWRALQAALYAMTPNTAVRAEAA